MVAIFYTPEIPKSWIAYQFERLGYDSKKCMRRLKYQASREKYRLRWKHLGRRNPQFIGRRELLRFYQRKNPNLLFHHPSWAIAILFDEVKQGMTQAAVERKYGLRPETLYKFKSQGRNSLTPVNKQRFSREEYMSIHCKKGTKS